MIDRRTALKLGAQVGVLGGIGLAGGYQLCRRVRAARSNRVDALAQRLFASLDAEQRAETCVPYDHPLRQYHNRGVMGGGRDILFGFSRRQRKILTDLMYAGLSEEGRKRVPEEFFTRWSGVHALRVADLRRSRDASLSGHPDRRPPQPAARRRSREGAAFGGPQVYGDQRGNERAGTARQRVPRSVPARPTHPAEPRSRRAQARGARRGAGPDRDRAPRTARLVSGNSVSELASEDKALACGISSSAFSRRTRPSDVAYARACLQANGGVDALFLSYYQHGEDGAITEGQVFRLEGPAAVFYFRGYPHVHAFVNVAMNADAPLSSGEELGRQPGVAGSGRREGAVRDGACAPRPERTLPIYPLDSVAGRLRPGAIRSGDIYSLESWQEAVEVVDVHGSNLSAQMVAKLPSTDAGPDRTKMYAIATTAYAARELGDAARTHRRAPTGSDAARPHRRVSQAPRVRRSRVAFRESQIIVRRVRL